DVGRLPDVLDVVRIATDHEGTEVLLDRGDHGKRPLRKGRAPEAIESGLAGQNLYYDQANPIWRGTDGLDVGDLEAGQGSSFAVVLSARSAGPVDCPTRPRSHRTIVRSYSPRGEG